MNPNQTNNGLPPLPQGEQPAPAQPVLYQPAEPQNVPVENIRTTTASSQWNSTPWIIGIFVMLILIVILTIVALNVYTAPSSSNSTSSSTVSSVVSSSASANNDYNMALTDLTFDAATGDWSYEVTGYLPTACHTATTEVIIMESFPEQVLINVNFTAPAEDTMCIQVLQEVTLTGTFKASEQATARLGSVRIV